MFTAIQQDLESQGDARQAAILPRLFQTGPGGYGQGDHLGWFFCSRRCCSPGKKDVNLGLFPAWPKIMIDRLTN